LGWNKTESGVASPTVWGDRAELLTYYFPNNSAQNTAEAILSRLLDIAFLWLYRTKSGEFWTISVDNCEEMAFLAKDLREKG
jgi:hypothetical protein